ncbi:LuxR C-terminal-related transcriptional regulator [Bradyrhizobium barranii]
MRNLLSPREKRLLRRLAAGKTDAEIAERLGGTAKQVPEQKARLLARWQIKSPDEIAYAAERWATGRAMSAHRGRFIGLGSKIICAAATGLGLTNG